MRIEGERPGEALGEVWLSLTPDEATRLRDALDAMLSGDDADPEWHAHVTADDGHGEITVGRASGT